MLKIVGAAALAGLCVWIGTELTPDTAVVMKTQVVKEYVIAPASDKAADTDMGAARPFGQSIAAPAAMVRPSALGAKMMSAKDLKTFVIEMLAPENVKLGGAFYAMRALSLCAGIEEYRNDTEAGVRRVVADKTTISQEQLTQMREGETKCGSLSFFESEALYNQALRQSLTGADPLSKAAMSRAENRLQVIADQKNLALASATDTAFLLLNERRISNDAGTTTVFNGQTYGPEDDRALDAAALLSTCIEGDYCKLEAERKVRCWFEAECYPTREAFVQARYLKGDRRQMDKTLAFAEQMRQALARGDTSIFR